MLKIILNANRHFFLNKNEQIETFMMQLHNQSSFLSAQKHHFNKLLKNASI
jgi:hypothetical protein